MQIVVLDDETNDLLKILKTLHKTRSTEKGFIVRLFQDVKSLLFYCSSMDAKRKDTRIALLDIHLMEDLFDGTEVSRRLKAVLPELLIIFCTKKKMDYIDKLDDVESFRIVQKDDLEKKLPMAILSAYKRFNIIDHKKEYIQFNYISEHIEKSINLCDIMYFYSENRKVFYHTQNGYEEGFYEKLDHVENTISNENIRFVRISKSYLLNWKYVKAVNGRTVIIGEEEFRISRSYFERIMSNSTSPV